MTRPTATVTGTSFQVVNGAGTYIIYSLSGALRLTANSAGTIVAGAQFNGVLRVVKLNSSSHKALLDQYVANYPTGVKTDYDFNGDVGTLRFTWTVTGNAANLLMLTWPHHRCVVSGGFRPLLMNNVVASKCITPTSRRHLPSRISRLKGICTPPWETFGTWSITSQQLLGMHLVLRMRLALRI